MQNSPASIILKLSVLCLFAFLMTSFVLYRMDYFEPIETATEDYDLAENEEYELEEGDTSKPTPIMSGSKSAIVTKPKKTKKVKVKKIPKNKKVTIMSGSKSGEIIPSSKSAPVFDSEDIIPSSKSGRIFTPEKIVVDSADKPKSK